MRSYIPKISGRRTSVRMVFVAAFVVLALLLAACGSSSGTGSAPTPNPKTPTVTPPNDLITAVAQRMGLKAHVVTTGFDTIIDSLTAKRFDVVISAVSVTPERQKKVDFVPYFNAGESLLVQAGNPKNIKALVDLCGQNVGVQDGTIEQADLQTANTNVCKKASKPAMNLTVLKNQTDVIQLLANNRVVATYQDSPVTDYYIKQHPGQFAVGGSVINAGLEGIVVRKGDSSMFNAVQTAFKQLKADGTYHTLITKWGLTNEQITMADRQIIA